MVELLYDPDMRQDQRPYAFKIYMHERVATHYPPISFQAAVDGTFATWLNADSLTLNS